MSAFILLLIRQGIAALGGYLAANGIAMDGSPTTHSLILGLCLMGFASSWSWLSKMLKIDYDISAWNATALRTALGSLISQGITFASAYYAVDANDPSALAVAVINAVASHYGVHQLIAFQTPIEKAAAIKAMALCLFMSCLVSCAALSTWLASPAGQATVSLASLGLDVAAAKGKIAPGQVITIKQGVAVISDPTASATDKVVKLEHLGLQEAVASGKLAPGDSLIIQQATAIIQQAVETPAPAPAAKQPVNVQPANNPSTASTAHGRELARDLSTGFDSRSAGHIPGCMRLADSMPQYGSRVAEDLAAQ